MSGGTLENMKKKSQAVKTGNRPQHLKVNKESRELGGQATAGLPTDAVFYVCFMSWPIFFSHDPCRV